MKAYPNHTKDERTLEIVVSGRGMHPICCKQKSVVVFNHPPHGDVEAGFECWVIQCFIQVTTEGNKEDFFDQEVPVGVVAQEQQQPNTGNENAAMTTTTTMMMMKNRVLQKTCIKLSMQQLLLVLVSKGMIWQWRVILWLVQ